MKISSNFDGGNIEVLSIKDHNDIQLKIRKDTNADYFQWFYFRLQGAEGYPCKMKIVNAGEASFPDGFENYYARASYDRATWFQVPTNFDGKTLTIDLMPKYNSVYIAYFAPFSYEQHLDMVHQAQLSPRCVLTSLGNTVEGRDIDFLIAGEPAPNKKKIWVIARQHPGETMAEWFMQGFINRLLDSDDPASIQLLNKAVFYLVPNINIDGSIHGNLRANAKGINLNREWAEPSLEKSPEVYYIKNKMEETGVDLNLDIHGDEGLPFVFLSGIEGIPSYDAKLQHLTEKFSNTWKQISPDFQDVEGYPKNEPKKANLAICSKNIGEQFKCLSQTIEMPFKQNNNIPDPIFGWSPDRSEKLGESLINTLLLLVDDI
ncbi:MAG: M14-type cytosolic carboxypeptidase [Salinivirgaceae bacterium]